MLSFVMLLPLDLSTLFRSPPVVTSIVAQYFDLLLHKLFSSCDKCPELLLHSLCHCLVESVRHVFFATVYAIHFWRMKDSQIVAAGLVPELKYVAASGQASGERVLITIVCSDCL